MGYIDDFKKTVQDNLSASGIAGALNSAGAEGVATYLPGSLLKLKCLQLKDLRVNIDINAIQTSSFNIAVGIKSPHDGMPGYWQIMEKPKLNIEKFRLEFGIVTFRSQAFPPPYIWHIKISGSLTIGAHLVLGASIQVPAKGDWRLKVVTQSGHLPTMDELADFIFPARVANSSPLQSILPDALLNDKLPIVLNKIEFFFNPRTPDFGGLSFELSQQGKWQLSDYLAITGWSVKMDVDVRGGNKVTGLLQGSLQIGQMAGIDIRLPFPAGAKGWTLSMKEGSTVNFPGIGCLLALVGSDAASSSLPCGFEHLGNFSLTRLSLTLQPQPFSVTEFMFGLRSNQQWIIWSDVLSFYDVQARLTLKKNAGTYVSTGVFNCLVDIAKTPVWIQASRNSIDVPWLFKLITRGRIHISGLSKLAQWMLPKKMEESIPDSFLPFGKGFDLSELDFEFDLTHRQLRKLGFSITNSDAWHVIPSYLILHKVEVTTRISVGQQNSLTDCNALITIAARLIIGETGILFNGTYKSEAPHWTFEAQLPEKASFHFAELLSTLHLDKVFHLPQDIGLPSLDVSSLTGKMIPETKYLSVDATILIGSEETDVDTPVKSDWQMDFAGFHFQMFGLTTHVEMKQDPQADGCSNCFKARIASVLHMNSLCVAVGMQLGSKGIDQIFTGSLTLEQISRLSVKQWTDGLIDEKQKNSSTWDKLTPNDMSLPAYAGAYVYYNHTQQFFALYGQIKKLGDGILLSQVVAQERRYVFAFALTDCFKFGDLFTALAPIDSVLSISEASIVVCSHAVSSATELVKQIGQVISLEGKPGSVTPPIKRVKLPSGEVKPGTHLYARLQLTGPLFSLFTCLSDKAEGLDLTLFASFSTKSDAGEGSGETVFKAIFDPFTMFGNIVSFKGVGDESGIVMTYRKSAVSEFTLSGIVGFDVFGKQYEFAGDLKVNADKTRFVVTTSPACDITIPLFTTKLPSLFVLKNLGLDIHYYFQTASRNESYCELIIDGKVELLHALFTEASLHLLNGVPVLAMVKLTRDFAIGQLIGSLVGKPDAWPADFPDITFKAETAERASRVYYYDAAKDTSPTRYLGLTDGYNLETTVELTLIATLCINLKIHIQKDEGVKAKAQLNNPIRILVVELAGQQKEESGHGKYIGGPILGIDTLGENATFILKTGVNFFEYPFCLADISLKKKNLSAGKSEPKISAQLTTSQAVPMLGAFSVSFSYCQSEGLVLGKLPSFTQAYESTLNVIDIAGEIKKIMKTLDKKFVCGSIVDLVAGVAYQNRFSIHPSLSTSGNSLSLQLNGKYMVCISDVEVATINFPEMLSVSLPPNVSFDDWGGLIENALKDAANSFVDNLRRNGAEWGKLAGILFAEEATELAAQWLCEGLIDVATAAAIAAAASAIETAGGYAAIAAGGAAAALILIKAMTKSKEKYEEGGGKPEPTPRPDPAPDPSPEAPSLYAQPLTYAKQLITLRWYGGAYATGYERVCYNPDGSQMGSMLSLDNKMFATDISLPRNSRAGVYKVKVRSVRQEKKSEWVEANITKLDLPSHVQLLWKDSKLQALWSQVDQNKGYEVALYQHGSLLQRYETVKDMNRWESDLTDLPFDTGDFTITVAARGDETVIESAVSEQSQPVSVEEQELPIVCHFKGKLYMVGLGATPRVELLSGEEQTPVQKQGVIQYGKDTVTILLDQLLPNTLYRIKIQTRNRDWSQVSKTISLPADVVATLPQTAILAIHTVVYAQAKSGTYQIGVDTLDKENKTLQSYKSKEIKMESSWRKDNRQLASGQNTASIKVEFESHNENGTKPQGLCILEWVDFSHWLEVSMNGKFPELDFSFKL